MLALTIGRFRRWLRSTTEMKRELDRERILGNLFKRSDNFGDYQQRLTILATATAATPLAGARAGHDPLASERVRAGLRASPSSGANRGWPIPPRQTESPSGVERDAR